MRYIRTLLKIGKPHLNFGLLAGWTNEHRGRSETTNPRRKHFKNNNNNHNHHHNKKKKDTYSHNNNKTTLVNARLMQNCGRISWTDITMTVLCPIIAYVKLLFRGEKNKEKNVTHLVSCKKCRQVNQSQNTYIHTGFTIYMYKTSNI